MMDDSYAENIFRCFGRQVQRLIHLQQLISLFHIASGVIRSTLNQDAAFPLTVFPANALEVQQVKYMIR